MRTILSLLILAFSQTNDWCAEFHVSSVEEFRQALSVAGSNSESDIISVSAGTYILTSPLIYTSSNPDGLIIEGSGGKPVLDGNNLTPVLRMNVQSFREPELVLRNISIQKGRVYQTEYQNEGGAGLFSLTSMRIESCEFIENKGNEYSFYGHGGAIHIQHGRVDVFDSTFVRNEGGVGAAIKTRERYRILRSRFDSNKFEDSLIESELEKPETTSYVGNSLFVFNASEDPEAPMFSINYDGWSWITNSLFYQNHLIVRSDSDSRFSLESSILVGNDRRIITMGGSYGQGPTQSHSIINNIIDSYLEHSRVTYSGNRIKTVEFLDSNFRYFDYDAIDRAIFCYPGDSDYSGAERSIGVRCDIGPYESDSAGRDIAPFLESPKIIPSENALIANIELSARVASDVSTSHYLIRKSYQQFDSSSPMEVESTTSKNILIEYERNLSYVCFAAVD